MGWSECGCSVIISKRVPCMLSETLGIDILSVLIKSFLFHHVGLSWMLETKDKYDYAVDENNSLWLTGGSWYNTTIFQNLLDNLSEYLFVNKR